MCGKVVQKFWWRRVHGKVRMGRVFFLRDWLRVDLFVCGYFRTGMTTAGIHIGRHVKHSKTCAVQGAGPSAPH